MIDRRETFDRLLAVWSGETEVNELNSLLSPKYHGHLGSRDRDVEALKRDIVDYRDVFPACVFAWSIGSARATTSLRG